MPTPSDDDINYTWNSELAKKARRDAYLARTTPPGYKPTTTTNAKRPGERPTVKLGMSMLKVKALKLILPDLANELDIPSEAPTFISPYITSKSMCHECGVWYSPLLYAHGTTTTAQHFCKDHGGIYVRLPEDDTAKWVYSNDLWHAVVQPNGPIRMGNDRGYQFKSVKVLKFSTPICISCGAPATRGPLGIRSSVLLPLCGECNSNHNLVDWTFRYSEEDGSIRFMRPMPQGPIILRREQTQREDTTSESSL